MALNSYQPDFAGTGPTLAAPTTSETIVTPDERTFLMVVIGGTATTITIVRPNTDDLGRAAVNMVIGPLTNATRIIKIGRNYKDPVTGNTTVNFSQVTAVTASVVRS